MEIIKSLKDIGHSKNSIKHLERYTKKYVKVVVFGLGYIGIPLLKQFKQSGIKCLGYDISEKRIQEIQNNTTKIANTNDIKDICTFDFEKVKEFSKPERIVYICCVPTLVKEDYSNDYSALENSLDSIKSLYSWMKDDILVIESTVGIGKVDELCKKRFKFYCYSPERISPNDNDKVGSIDKLLATNNKRIDKFIFSLYKKAINNLYLIRDDNSIKIAEASKLIENTQRDVNIALMNEYQLFCSQNKINIKDVLNVAGTKWNFANYQPGLVGGQCIGVDPYYIINENMNTPLIKLARETNENRISETINFVENIIKDYNKEDILILGKTYKPNCASVENSGAFKICKYFNDIQSYDPLIDLVEVPFQNKKIFVLLVNQKDFSIYFNNHIKSLKNFIMIDPFGYLYNIKHKFQMYYTL